MCVVDTSVMKEKKIFQMFTFGVV